MLRERAACAPLQAKVFKGAFEARKEKGLWGEPAAGVQQQHRGILARLWANLLSWLGSLLGFKVERL